MAGTTLHPAASQAPVRQSIISGDILAIVVSVVACSISAVFMLALIPVERQNAHDTERPAASPLLPSDSFSQPVGDIGDPSCAEEPRLPDPASRAPDVLPIEKNGNRFHIALCDIVSVHANAHYTYVFNGRDDLFCPLSITEIETRVPKPDFFRTHRSYIVNLACVARIKKVGDAGVVELDTPIRRTVPISRARMPALRQELLTFTPKAGSPDAGI